MLPERTPVIVGIGQLCDRDNRLDSLDLMVAALRRADADGGGGWIARADSLSTVAQISFPDLGDTAHAAASSLGITPRLCAQTPWPTGESPVELLHAAANRIGAGEIEVALVTGGEALRTAAARRAGDTLRDVAATSTPKGLARYGLVAPTDLYPLFENATRAAWGQTLAEAQAESGAIWAAMSRVAAANPAAWLQRVFDADEIVTLSDDNRMIAFPYTKRQVANSVVNMGAGFVVTSLACARAAGVPDGRLVHIGAGAAGHEPLRITDWARYDVSPSMVATLTATLERNALTVADLDHVELYSCFPCIPKMARRVIGWPLGRPVTVFGGLTFGGGPIGNYMSHAIAAMAMRLRGSAEKGLLYANGGYATHNHAMVLSGSATGTQFPHDAHVAHPTTAPPPLVEQYQGEAAIETFTMPYARNGTVAAAKVIARTTDGARVVAAVDRGDHATLAALQSEGRVIGLRGSLSEGADGRAYWSVRGDPG